MTKSKEKNSLVAETKAKFELLTQKGPLRQNAINQRERPIKKLPIEKITPFETLKVQKGDCRFDQNGPVTEETSSALIEKKGHRELETEQLTMSNIAEKRQNTPLVEGEISVEENSDHPKDDYSANDVEGHGNSVLPTVHDRFVEKQTKNCVNSNDCNQRNILYENIGIEKKKKTTVSFDCHECAEYSKNTKKEESDGIHTPNTSLQPEFSEIKHTIAKQMTESFFKDTRFKRQNPFLLDQITDEENKEENKKTE